MSLTPHQMGVPQGADEPVIVRHFCGNLTRHTPHIGCNGFGYDAGPPEDLCTRTDIHVPHRSCDGWGEVDPGKETA